MGAKRRKKVHCSELVENWAELDTLTWDGSGLDFELDTSWWDATSAAVILRENSASECSTSAVMSWRYVQNGDGCYM